MCTTNLFRMPFGMVMVCVAGGTTSGCNSPTRIFYTTIEIIYSNFLVVFSVLYLRSNARQAAHECVSIQKRVQFKWNTYSLFAPSDISVTIDARDACLHTISGPVCRRRVCRIALIARMGRASSGWLAIATTKEKKKNESIWRGRCVRL